jgi:hypothetical protein
MQISKEQFLVMAQDIDCTRTLTTHTFLPAMHQPEQATPRF